MPCGVNSNFCIGKTLLDVKGLTVNYGNVTALHPLDMDIKAGEILGLLGPNGAGKTSFIKALCGRTTNWSGDVSIDGITIKHGDDRRQLIGLVPQEIALYPHMTALENLTVFASMMGLSKSDGAKAAEDALRAVGLEDKANERVTNLSGGMKRRINVGCAVMHNPKLIILDEPTAGVDHPARDSIHKIARELANSGLAILLVTHELERAEAICDRILVLNKGRKLAFDTPVSVLNKLFADTREVHIRFGIAPDEDINTELNKFSFKPTDVETVWTTMTNQSEADFVSAFMVALKDDTPLVREISVRRPGLPTLMHFIQKRELDRC